MKLLHLPREEDPIFPKQSPLIFPASILIRRIFQTVSGPCFSHHCVIILITNTVNTNINTGTSASLRVKKCIPLALFFLCLPQKHWSSLEGQFLHTSRIVWMTSLRRLSSVMFSKNHCKEDHWHRWLIFIQEILALFHYLMHLLGFHFLLEPQGKFHNQHTWYV